MEKKLDYLSSKKLHQNMKFLGGSKERLLLTIGEIDTMNQLSDMPTEYQFVK